MKKIKTKDLYPEVGKIHNYVVDKNEIDNALILQNLRDRLNLNETEKEDIKNIILECIWISRWTNEEKNSLYAVLTVDEALKIVDDVFNELDKNGFKIIKK